MAGLVKRIGLLGGTFDPVHNGHLSIAQSFLKSNEIEELWIILNPTPPHKPNAISAPYHLRFKMLEVAFRNIAGAKISSLERRLPTPTYTLQTLKYLLKTHPGYEFKLCMGKDSFSSFKTWYKWEQIVERCGLIVANRPLSNREGVDPDLHQYAVFVDHEPLDISSTEIRRMIKSGEPVNHLVPKSALHIIRAYKLYQ